MNIPTILWSLHWRKTSVWLNFVYCQISNIRYTLVGNTFVDHSDIVGASPVGTAQTASSFSIEHVASMDWTKTTARRDKKHLSLGIWCILYWRFDSTYIAHLSWQLSWSFVISCGRDHVLGQITRRPLSKNAPSLNHLNGYSKLTYQKDCYQLIVLHETVICIKNLWKVSISSFRSWLNQP